MFGTVTISNQIGSNRLLSSSDVMYCDSSTDIWNNSAGTALGTPQGLSTTTPDVISMKKGADITAGFAPNAGEDDGQGFLIPSGLYTEVTAKSGDVYFISKTKGLTLDKSPTQIYADNSRIEATVGMLVSGGFLLCAGGASFSIKIYAPPEGGGIGFGSVLSVADIYQIEKYVKENDLNL